MRFRPSIWPRVRLTLVSGLQPLLLDRAFLLWLKVWVGRGLLRRLGRLWYCTSERVLQLGCQPGRSKQTCDLHSTLHTESFPESLLRPGMSSKLTTTRSTLSTTPNTIKYL